MAISVIIAGALLFLGGAISLGFGFDIVMTERGSAMTLGGIIAISGGIISIGIGLCLLRLTQLLAVMEAKRPRHPTLHDRPVVPIVNGDVDKKDMETTARTLPQSLAVGAGTIGAGLAAAASIAGGLAVSDRDDRLDQVRSVEDRTDLEPDVLRGPQTDQITLESEQPAPIAIPDLEAELSRALQENEAPSAAEPTFSSSLTGLLAKPPARKRRLTLTDTSKNPESEPEPVESKGVDQTIDEVADEVLTFERTDTTMTIERMPKTGTTQTTDDAAITVTQVDGMALERTVPDTVDVAEINGQPDENNASRNQEAAEAVTEGTHAQPELRQPDIIGSYKVGGRSYTMFVDGSVEAMTENGVQRFESMDQLRRHLSGTRA